LEAAADLCSLFPAVLRRFAACEFPAKGTAMQRRNVVRSGLGLLTAAWLLVGGAAQALDPRNAGYEFKYSLFKWNQLPEEKKNLGKKMIVLCSRRLWLDWQEQKGPTWCWVRNRQPVGDTSRPSEAPFLPAYDGYGDEQLGWAKLCWDEMFGNPSRNTNDGVQALLASAHGTVHRDLKQPIGEQVPGQYNFGAGAALDHAEDEPKAGGKKSKGGAE